MRYTEKWAWGVQTKVKKNTYSLDCLHHQWTTISDAPWMVNYRAKIRAIETIEQARDAIYDYQREVVAAITELNEGVHDDGK